MFMARNRKNQSVAVRFGVILKVVLACFFIGGSAVGYVWQKNQIFVLGRQIKQGEDKLEDLSRQCKVVSDQLAYLSSRRVLDARVKELNLGLLPAQPEQIVRLVDGPVGAAARPPEPNLAVR